MISASQRILAVLAVAATMLFGTAPSPRAAYYIDAGGDTLMQPEMAAEFLLTYAGQVFTFAGVDSASSLVGFLNNDCRFGGVLANCNWDPQGRATSIDAALTIIPLTTTQINTYAQNLGQLDGPIIQYPVYATPIAIVLQNPSIRTNGKLALSDDNLCGIFSGKIINWTGLPGGIPAAVFDVVYDSEAGSGSTWLLTQHLHAVCTRTNSSFTTLPVPITGNFRALPIAGLAGNARFIAAAGSAAMRGALLGNHQSIGYIGPNYTSIAPSAEMTSSLVVASILNRHQMNKSWLPTTANVIVGLRNVGNGAINVNAPATQATVSDPTRWVPQVPDPSAGYPIVGYANWVWSACYAINSPIILQYLLTPYMPTAHAMEVSRNGFVPLNSINSGFYAAVKNTLLSNNLNFNVNMQNPPLCAPYFGR